MSCSVDRVSYEQNGRGNDLPSKLLVFSRWFTVRRMHSIANYRTKTAKVIQTGARPKNALFTIKLSMKLSWSKASGLLATSYSISQSKKLYFSLGFRFSEISAVPFVLWSANQKNRFFPLSQSLYWRPPADQKASGLWVRDWGNGFLEKQFVRSAATAPTQSLSKLQSFSPGRLQREIIFPGKNRQWLFPRRVATQK